MLWVEKRLTTRLLFFVVLASPTRKNGGLIFQSSFQGAVGTAANALRLLCAIIP